jgi:putative transposase
VAIVVKPTTLLNYHKALVKRKYSILYSHKAKKKPVRKGQDEALIDLVIEVKAQNTSFGYGRIAMQIFEAFGIEIARFAVGRILRKNKHKLLPRRWAIMVNFYWT